MSRWRIWRHDLGAQLDRCAHDTLAVWSGQQDAKFVSERNEVGFGLAAFFARLAVAGARQERSLHALGGTGTQQCWVCRRRGADENQVDLAVGQLGDIGNSANAEHLFTMKVGAVHAARVTTRKNVVQRDEPKLARVR